MKIRSLIVKHTEFADMPASAGPCTLLDGFMHHLQQAQRDECEARRLYASSDAELDAMGISREGILASRDIS